MILLSAVVVLLLLLYDARCERGEVLDKAPILVRVLFRRVLLVLRRRLATVGHILASHRLRNGLLLRQIDV